MEHEVRRKTIFVSPDSLIEDSGFYSVKKGEIGVEQDLLVANEINFGFDSSDSWIGHDFGIGKR